MKCHNCGSEEHFAAECPRPKGSGKGSNPSAFAPFSLFAGGSGSLMADAPDMQQMSGAIPPPWETGELQMDLPSLFGRSASGFVYTEPEEAAEAQSYPVLADQDPAGQGAPQLIALAGTPGAVPE